MSYNAIGQWSGSHKVWDHVGNVVPAVEFSPGDRPALALKVARWLPVQFYDKFYEDYWVLMPGKGVSLDNDGCAIPAGVGVTGAAIAYTQADIDSGTIDITTGEACASVVSYDVADIDGSTYDFMGRAGVAIAASAFIGVCPLGYRQWEGDGSEYDDGINPAGFRKLNYNMQHGVTVVCDYMLELPIVPATTTTEAVTFTAPTDGVSTNTGDALAALPVAKNTMRTQIVFTDTGSGDSALFVNEVDAATDVVSAGDWHVDLDTGIITVYSGSTTPTGMRVTYRNYATAPTGTNVSRFACILGDIGPGDFLKYNVDSNYVVATGGTDCFDEIVAQVLEIKTYPQGGLDKVRTAFTSLGTDATGALPGYDGQLDQMPGTATGGVSAKIHYAGAADKVAVINLISR